MEHIRLYLESPLWQSGSLIAVIVLAVLLTRLSGQKLLEFGVHLGFVWLILMLLGSWMSPTYWQFLGTGLLAFLLFFSCWLLLLKICDRYGQPCLGEGGLAVLLPVVIIPHIVVVSLLGRGLMALFSPS
ncbi:MAG: hypothetical protein NVV73_10755 [Cellvibrionaceae bacterium]|nr:hypothetical protein [Cellvibrionaceae bacterium]